MPDDRAAVEDDDPVGAHDRPDALGDDHHGRVADLAVERRPEPRVGLEVERREAVVEDVDLGPLDERAGDRERWRWPPDRFEPPWVTGASSPSAISRTNVLGLGDPQGVPQLVVGRVGLAEAEVAGDRAAEQERLLRDEPDPRPDVVAGAASRTSTPSIVRLPAGDVVEARDEVDQRGLAAARAADDGGRLARLDDQRDVAQDRVLGARVAELDVAELERPGRRRWRQRRLRVARSWRSVRRTSLDPAGRDDPPAGPSRT